MDTHGSGCGGTAPLPSFFGGGGGEMPLVPPGSYAYDQFVPMIECLSGCKEDSSD